MNNTCANTAYLNEYLDNYKTLDHIGTHLNRQVLDLVKSYMIEGWDVSSVGRHDAPREVCWEALAEMGSDKACDALVEAIKAELDGDLAARGVALNDFSLSALQGAIDYLRSAAQSELEGDNCIYFDLDDYKIKEATPKLERTRCQHTMISGVKLTLDVCCLDGDYTIWQVMPDESLSEIFLSNVELAKVIAEFKEGKK